MRLLQNALAAAFASSCFISSVAQGQSGSSVSSITTTSPAAMPGQAVGTTFNLMPAGKLVPKAAPQVGSSPGSPLTKPYDPTKPLDAFTGTNIDTSSIVAPVSGYPGISTQNPTLLESVMNRVGSLVGLSKTNTTGPTPMITPGIFRRSHERAVNRNWRRD